MKKIGNFDACENKLKESNYKSFKTGLLAYFQMIVYVAKMVVNKVGYSEIILYP